MYHYYVLVVLSVLLFLIGFFPTSRTSIKIKNDPPTHINSRGFPPEVYSSDIEKTILIVIDALRLDFVNTQYMPLVSKIAKESGCFNIITVETPTVTLPRIKALTAGNVPQFIDLVLNLASTEVLQDSLIHSLYRKRKKIVFYGDDTWLKLFPNFFTRYEGTSSFYVRDFHEVDDNVTRNVNIELKNNDWEMMILHYLGLDHIGHVYGPFSSHIPDKLKEMDEIIYRIYTEMSKKNESFSMIVTGDHGMRDSGGHGGASYQEMHVPLLGLGLECVNDTFFQIDIPVNLAVLLGLNIPSNSIGKLSQKFLPKSLEKYLFALRYNNLLLSDKANLCEDQFSVATKYHELYLETFDQKHARSAIEVYENCSSIISQHLMKSSANQNFYSLIISMLVMINLLMVLTKIIITQNCDNTLGEIVEFAINFIIICIELIFSNHLFSILFATILLYFSISRIISFAKMINMYSSHISKVFILLSVTIIHPVTFFSSSFIEEEHQFWYSLNNVFIIYTVLSSGSGKNRQTQNILACLGLLIFFRFLRTINSTGDKWANYPDLSDWLLKIENYYYLQIFFISGLITIFFICAFVCNKRKVNMLNFIILFSIFLLKTTEHNNVMLGKLIWFLIFCHAISFYECPKIINWVLISCLLLKPYNILLISYCICVSTFISKICQSSTIITLCHFWLGNALYFAQGHSNSFASVDISVGYIGLTEYQPFVVILQVLSHTYSFPILCYFLIFRIKKVEYSKVWTLLLCNRLYIILVTCIITIIFRHHLFIWSVFAPKLFIEAIHIMSLFVAVGVFFCLNKLKLFVRNISRYNITKRILL